MRLFVTTSKAPVTTSVALVSNSFLLDVSSCFLAETSWHIPTYARLAGTSTSRVRFAWAVAACRFGGLAGPMDSTCGHHWLGARAGDDGSHLGGPAALCLCVVFDPVAWPGLERPAAHGGFCVRLSFLCMARPEAARWSIS